MIKIMEDVQVKYDGTVRNSVGSIIQFAYGSDNLDGSVAVVLNNEPHVCDIQRLVDRVNLNHELHELM